MRLFLVIALPLLGFGCSSTDTETTGTSSGETGDGHYHPPPNGIHVAEMDACDSLAAAREARRQALGCVGTNPTCPSLLRVQFGTNCMEYDQGSVDGCVDHYNDAKTCETLSLNAEDCRITPYPGTEPAGCP